MKAIILAGGFGKRLKPLTDSIPKPLIRILDKPIIYWQIQWLLNYKIKDFIICAGYMKDNIINYLGDGSNLNINIEEFLRKHQEDDSDKVEKTIEKQLLQEDK